MHSIFRHGFVDELLKLAAFPQQQQDVKPYNAGIESTLNKIQGPKAAQGGLKGGSNLPPPVGKKAAPTPMTTPNHMTDYVSMSDGGR